MVRSTEEDIYREKKKKSETGKDVQDDGDRPWSELPELLLHSISTRLNILDGSTFGRVCRAWRLVSRQPKTQEYMSSQPPMLMTRSIRDAKEGPITVLYSLPENKFYTAKKPQISSRSCIGYSRGYLVMMDTLNEKLQLVNPMTVHEIDLPWPSCSLKNPFLSSSLSISSLDCIFMSFTCITVHYCRLRDMKWEAFHCSGLWDIQEFTAFGTRAYVLTSGCKVLIFDFNPCPKVTEVVVGDGSIHSRRFQTDLSSYIPFLFEEGNGELLLLHLDVNKKGFPDIEIRNFAVYRLNILEDKWEKQESLGGRALFAGNQWCFLSANPTAWGGRENSIYLTGSTIGFCRVYSFDGALVEVITPSYPHPLEYTRNWISPT